MEPQRPRADRSSSSWALASLSLAMFLSSLGGSIANVGLPSLEQAFSASFQQIQWIVLSYLLAINTLIINTGRLADTIGRRKLLLAGIALFTVASALAGAASSLPFLIFARVAQGLGGAIMPVLAVAFLGDIVSKEKMAGAMGWLGTLSSTGTALGPSLGGILIAAFGWRAIFLANVPLCIAAFLIARRSLPADRTDSARKGRPLDIGGTVLLVLSLASYCLAMTIGQGRFGPLNILLLAAASAGGLCFVLLERRVKDPLIALSLFRDPLLCSNLATSVIASTVMMATLVVGPFYLSRALALDTAEIGLAMSAGPLVAALVSAPGGRLADRFGRQRVAGIGLITMVAGCAAIATLSARPGLVLYAACIVVVTIGYALFQVANNSAVVVKATPETRGIFSGLINLSRNIGFITGASVMGALFAAASGVSDTAAAHPDAVAYGFRAVFGLAALLTAIAVALAIGGQMAARRAVG